MAQVYKGIGTKIAKMPGVQPALDTAAATVLARAKTLAAGHVDTGAYAESLGVEKTPGKKGVVDRLVYSDDPAAAHIEYGHITRGPRPRYVPGQFILTKAARGGS